MTRVDFFETFQEEREKDAPFIWAEGMNLVDDHVRERAECRSCPTSKHQMQGFGRRDQDVGRLSEHPLPIVGRRVTGPDRDRQRRERRPFGLRRGDDPVQGELEVSIDVVVEGLERRDVENPDTSDHPGIPPEVIEAGQEGSEGFPRSRWREKKGVPAFGDRGPAQVAEGAWARQNWPETSSRRQVAVIPARR